jgi:hypothetical protein
MAKALRKSVRVVGKGEKAARELTDKLLACVPDTWLDPLLTGPTAVVRSDGAFTCPDIEALCKAIRARLTAVLSERHSK